jgi:hypothetical protein
LAKYDLRVFSLSVSYSQVVKSIMKSAGIWKANKIVIGAKRVSRKH